MSKCICGAGETRLHQIPCPLAESKPRFVLRDGTGFMEWPDGHHKPAVAFEYVAEIEWLREALETIEAIAYGEGDIGNLVARRAGAALRPETAPPVEGHKPSCFVYRHARALIGADRRGMCDCGFEASQRSKP